MFSAIDMTNGIYLSQNNTGSGTNYVFARKPAIKNLLYDIMSVGATD